MYVLRRWWETDAGPIVAGTCRHCGEFAAAAAGQEHACGACLRARHDAPAPGSLPIRAPEPYPPGATGVIRSEARRTWLTPAGTPWPAPIVPATEISPFDPAVPKGARSFALLAVEHGWRTLVTYARGTYTLATLEPTGELTSKGKPAKKLTGPPRVADSVAVRCGRKGERIAAIWIDGKFDDAWLNPWRKLTLAQIREKVADASEQR